MKKFMTDIKTLAALLMAGAAFTACSSSDDSIIDEQPVNPAQKTYTLTVNAAKGDGATTRALTLDGSTLNATWATTEKVYVKKDAWSESNYLQPQANAATATLTGDLSGMTIAADDVLTLQFPKSGDITYAGQLGTLADIQANFDWATATVDVESVSPSGNINPKTATTTFTNQQAIVKFTLKDKANDAAISPSALTVTDGTSTVSLTSIPGTTYSDPKNGAGVLYVAFPAAGSAKTITLNATVGTDTYTYETATAKTFTNGQYYEITVKMTKQIPAARTAEDATAEDKGKLIGTDGKIYADVAAATAAGTTAVAKIIYIGTTGHATYTHGLALALTDEGEMAWQAAIDACSTKNTSTPVTDATWLLASRDQWEKMMGANGAGSNTALRDGFTSVGGSNLQSGDYWSGTELDSNVAWYYGFGLGDWYDGPKVIDSIRVRACLAF